MPPSAYARRAWAGKGAANFAPLHGRTGKHSVCLAATYLYGTAGSTTYSNYMDRYNRPIKATWRRTHGSSRKFIDASMDYDLAGNAVAVADAVLMDAQSTPVPTFDRLDTYDSLRRLIAREEGQLNGGHTSITTRSRIEGAARNLAGRITSDQISLNKRLLQPREQAAGCWGTRVPNSARSHPHPAAPSPAR